MGVSASQSVKAESVAVEPTFLELHAGAFKCPAPREVKCKAFAESVGSWAQNGGYRASYNTAYMPNNQCANVIKINENGNNSRLLCCYKECGVLYLDVKFQNCTKPTPSDFRCQ